MAERSKTPPELGPIVFDADFAINDEHHDPVMIVLDTAAKVRFIEVVQTKTGFGLRLRSEGAAK